MQRDARWPKAVRQKAAYPLGCSEGVHLEHSALQRRPGSPSVSIFRGSIPAKVPGAAVPIGPLLGGAGLGTIIPNAERHGVPSARRSSTLPGLM